MKSMKSMKIMKKSMKSMKSVSLANDSIYMEILKKAQHHYSLL